ncbi:hypothetical protein YA0697_14335 [Pseudomonas viridiflava]|uniref:hypothetical protein n=1 Tax=Pseudomonas viridiflava TaxID=33069 RepID=UPI0018E5E3D2|nr:hypothetical protein [Pseudomonas viridiflava]MBI6682892.1 hypothetical protein [Pseudomonas viridiflava]
MISPELSMIQRNKERSAVLEAEVAEFLKRGGVIGTLQGFAYKPRPYGRMGPAVAPAPHRRTRAAIQAAAPKPTPAQDRADAEAIQLKQVRELAKTMTLSAAGRESGLSKHMLKRYSAEGGFEFQRYQPPLGVNNAKTDRIDPIADAMNVLRIKEARDRGLSRNAAKNLIGISSTLMERLIADFNIDYPAARIYRK